MPACMTRGTYTIQTNGANHTESTCQFHKTSVVCFWNTKSHPRPKKQYAAYLSIRKCVDGTKEDAARGRPRRTDKDAAREKLSSVTIDMTVEARQRLSAFKMTDTEAASSLEGLANVIARIGREENNKKIIGGRALKKVSKLFLKKRKTVLIPGCPRR